MTGPAVHSPARKQEFTEFFGHVDRADADTLLKIMAILHQGSLSKSFAALVGGEAGGEGAIELAHFFEEIGSLALHRQVSEELLFDAFAFDLYWAKLGPVVSRARQENPKFCENFELLAQAAQAYRKSRPPKVMAGAER